MSNIQDLKMLIDGHWVAASDNRYFESFDPSSNAVWSRVPETTAKYPCYRRSVQTFGKQVITKLGSIRSKQTSRLFGRPKWLIFCYVLTSGLVSIMLTRYF